MLLLYDTKSLLINSFMINFILLVIFDIFRDRMCEKKKKFPLLEKCACVLVFFREDSEEDNKKEASTKGSDQNKTKQNKTGS